MPIKRFNYIKRNQPIIIVALLLVLCVVVIGTIAVFKRNNRQPLACADMLPINPKDLNPFKELVAVDAKEAVNKGIQGNSLIYSLSDASPSAHLQLSGDRGNYDFNISLVGESDKKFPQSKISKNHLTFNNVFTDTKIEYETYKNQLKETIYLKSSKSPISFDYFLNFDPAYLNVSLDTGGYAIITEVATGKELAIFPAPQGIDAKSYRIDYQYELLGQVLRISPSRPWQLGCAKFPITIDPPIAGIGWNEALVMVGTNSNEPNTANDGDIIDIKPAGWHWGVEERQRFAIVKVPAISPSERDRIVKKSMIQQFEDYGPVPIPPEDQFRVATVSGVPLFGIDYTSLATPENLKDIRNPHKDSPVLDASDKPDTIKQKTSIFQSVISPEKYLATRPSPPPPSPLEKLTGVIVPNAQAAGTITKSIGSGGGRDYSTIGAWETACGGATSCDLVANTEIARGEMYADSTFTENVVIDSFTSGNSSYYPILTAATGEKHTGIAGTGVVLNPSVAGFGITISDPYTTLEWIEVTDWSDNSAGSFDAINIAADQVLVQYVVVHHDGNGTQTNSDAGGIQSETNSITFYVRNAIVYEVARIGIGYNQADSTTMNLENSTCYRCYIEDTSTVYGSILSDSNVGSSTANVKNTMAMGDPYSSGLNFKKSASDSWGTSTNNMSWDASAPGSNAQLSKTDSLQFVSITASSENLHLIPTSDAINTGTTATPTDDIDGDTRPVGASYDIGADEFIRRRTASLEYYFSNTSTSFTDTNNGGTPFWADVTTGTPDITTVGSTNGWLDGTNFTVGDRYLIMVWGSHGNNNTGIQGGMRVNHGGVSFTESESIEGADPANNYTQIHWWTVWTAANEDIEVQYYHPGTGEVRIADVTLLAINVEELIRNGDFYYDIDTTGGTLDTNPTAKAAVSWSPATNNDTWWINAYSKADIIDITSDDYHAQLDIDNGTVKSIQDIEGEVATDSPVYGLGWIQEFAVGSHTAEIEISEDAADQEWDAAGIFALRLNAFYDFAYEANAGTQTITSGAGVYQEIANFDHTPSITSNWLVAGGYITDDKNQEVENRIQSAGVSITVQDGGYNSHTASLTPNSVADIKSYTSSVNMDIDWDVVPTFATQTPEAEDTWLLGIALIKPSEPVAHWKFDDSTGTTANDSSRFLNSLTTSGASWQIASANDIYQRNRYLQFDGSNDYASRAADNDFNFGDGSFTITGWFNHTPTISGTDTILAYQSGPGYKVYMNSSGFLCFAIDDDGAWTPDDSVCTTTSYADGRWHHFSAVKDSTVSLSLYLDGMRIAQDTSLTATSSLSNAAAMYIGIDSDGTSNPWMGNLDEVIIYNYARSSSDVKQDFTSAAVNFGIKNADPLSEGLLGWWKMDESAADGCGTSDNCDSSGNSNHGAWNGNATAGTGKYGWGATVDGTGDYVSVADSTSLDSLGGTQQMTIATWVNPSINYSAMASAWYYFNAIAGPTYRGWEFGYEGWNDGVSFKPYNNSGTGFEVRHTTTLTSGTWYHYTAVVNGSFVGLYRNGILVDSRNDFTGTLRTDTTSFNIGGESGSNYFTGTFDEVRLYNKALSASEIQSLYTYAPGPVAYWNFDEGSGTGTISDRSGTGNTGTINGTASNANWVPGKFGSAYDFDGSTNYISVPDHGSTSIGNKDFTLMAWIKSDSATNGQEVITKSVGANDKEYELYVNSLAGTVGFESENNGSGDMVTTSSTPITLNTWHHIAASFNAATLGVSIYVNGVKQPTTGSITQLPDDLSANIHIGKRTYAASYFNGALDEVKIYNYVRTDSQVIEDMNAGHPAPGSPVGSSIAWYKFDEGYGDAANNSGTGGSTLNGDLGGSGQTCPATGTVPCPAWTNDGKLGKSTDFDGTDDYIQISDNNAFDFTGDMSVSAWVMKENADNVDKRIISKWGDTDAERSYLLQIGGTGTVFAFVTATANESRTASSITTPAQNVWYHLVGVRRNNKGYIYVNGKLEGITPADFTTTTRVSTTPIRIGHEGDGTTSQYFDGKIDEVRFYDSGLTDEQVKLLYNQSSAAVWGGTGTTSTGTPDNSAAREYCIPGDTSTCNPPFAHYSFDENTGSSTLRDISGNNYSGTLSGFEGDEWQPGKFGSSLNFDGANETINLYSSGFDTAFDGNTGTITAWLKVPASVWTDGANRRAIEWETDSSNQVYIGKMNTNDFIIEREAGGLARNIVGSIGTPTDWFHVAVTWDSAADTQIYYINGTFYADETGQAINDWTGALNSNTTTLGSSGYAAPTNDWIGNIDDVRAYNYVRTPAQIAYDYNRGKPFIHYRFDEGTGGTTNDLMGNYDGTVTIGGSGTNTTTTAAWSAGATGKNNGSLDFDGTDDYITLTDDILDTHSIGSICAWANFKESTDNGNTFMIFAYSDTAGTTYKANLYIDDSGTDDARLQFYNRVNTTSNYLLLDAPNAAIARNQWQHVCVTQDGTMPNLYINGVNKTENRTVVGTATLGSWFDDIAANAENATIGREEDDVPGDYFKGQIDDFMLWNYGLTPQQVKDVYSQGAVQFR